MKPQAHFKQQHKDFWAYVRLLGQEIGYSERGTGQIKVPKLAEIERCFRRLKLDTDRITSGEGRLTQFGDDLLTYLESRALILNRTVEPLLMDAETAKRQFELLRKKLRPKCPVPMNKQKGDKKRPAYLTGIVNMLIEANAEGINCDYDPRVLTTVTRNGSPLRTLARRVDGAFPAAINPFVIWEVKEYYYTTTFGSRVADGIYETLLDGMELEELRVSEGIHVRHCLMVDARYTWWDCGKSYLCRLIDMLHMGYVDEILFGKEVIERMPSLVKEWVATVGRR